MVTVATSNTSTNDHNKHDDDDLSSLGDASPMHEAQIQQRRRQKQVRIRLGTICFVAIYILVYMSLSSAPTMIMDDIHSIRNKTDLAQTRKEHIRHVASSFARVYPPVSPSVWCIDGRLKMEQSKRRPMGLSYLKIPRAASSTLAGINQRIARNFAQRQSLENCIRHDGHVPGMYYSKRDPLSFLWTLVRNPNTRAMSRIARTLSNDRFISNSTVNANTSSYVIQALKKSNDVQYGAVSMGRGGFQLQYSMLTIIEEGSAWNASDPAQVINPRQVQRHVLQVVNGYDFIGVVERFDESLVALQLLLGLETSDITYFSIHTESQFERRPVKRKRNTFDCRQNLNWQTFMTSPVVNHLESTEWFAQNYGDYLLYQAANQSLDMTIWRLGLDVFSKALKEFRSTLALARETCHPVFPCSSNGTDQYEASQENCYFDDIGCGYPCLNELAATNGVNISII